MKIINNSLQGLVVDVDGVLEFQGRVYPSAVETIQRLKKRGIVLRFLTNSTLKSRASCTTELRKQGFSINDDEVITASFATAAYLREIKPRSCWVMLDGEGIEEFRDFYQDTENPEYIVVGDYRYNFNFENMNKALRLLNNGAKLIGMIPELVDSSLRELEVNVGSWVQLLERAAQVKAIYIGKPFPYAMELTLETMDLPRERIAMIGDKVNVDVVCARNAGIQSILVKTGEFDPQDVQGEVQADFMVDSIQNVLAIV